VIELHGDRLEIVFNYYFEEDNSARKVHLKDGVYTHTPFGENTSKGSLFYRCPLRQERYWDPPNGGFGISANPDYSDIKSPIFVKDGEVSLYPVSNGEKIIDASLKSKHEKEVAQYELNRNNKW